MKVLIERNSDRAEWLAPWTGGAKLISVFDVKEYLASRLVSISNCLIHCQLICLECSSGESPTKEHRDDLARYLKDMDEELKFLGLEMTRLSVTRMKSQIATITRDKLAESMDDIENRFNDEVRPVSLLYLAPEKRRFFSKTDLFGEEFKTRFPTANAEVIEAGNCFALDRFTACVYHLCRSMEVGMRVLFVSLGMPPRVWSTTKWSRILDRIKGKIDKNNKVLADDYEWQSLRSFYESTYAFLSAVRVPIRNSTVHVESSYDEAGAENVFGAVKTFMRHLATKLKETP
jgi:hypothetical protein